MFVLLGNGTENLGDEFRVAPNGRRVFDEPGTRLRILLVPERRPLPRPGLDEDPVTGPRELVDRIRRKGDSALPRRKLAYDPNPHFASPNTTADAVAKWTWPSPCTHPMPRKVTRKGGADPARRNGACSPEIRSKNVRAALLGPNTESPCGTRDEKEPSTASSTADATPGSLPRRFRRRPRDPG